MDWDDLFPWFALAAFGAFGLSLKSFFEARSLRAEFTTLAARVQTLDAQLERPQTAPPIVEPAPPPAPAAGPLPEPADAAAEATTEALELPVAPQPVAAASCSACCSGSACPSAPTGWRGANRRPGPRRLLPPTFPRRSPRPVRQRYSPASMRPISSTT